MTRAKRLLEYFLGTNKVAVNPRNLDQVFQKCVGVSWDQRMKTGAGRTRNLIPQSWRITVDLTVDRGDVYVWNAYDAVHKEQADYLGLEVYASGRFDLNDDGKPIASNGKYLHEWTGGCDSTGKYDLASINKDKVFKHRYEEAEHRIVSMLGTPESGGLSFG